MSKTISAFPSYTSVLTEIPDTAGRGMHFYTCAPHGDVTLYKRRRPIADVRADLRYLENQLTHAIIAQQASKLNEPRLQVLRDNKAEIQRLYPKAVV